MFIDGACREFRVETEQFTLWVSSCSNIWTCRICRMGPFGVRQASRSTWRARYYNNSSCSLNGSVVYKPHKGQLQLSHVHQDCLSHCMLSLLLLLLLLLRLRFITVLVAVEVTIFKQGFEISWRVGVLTLNWPAAISCLTFPLPFSGFYLFQVTSKMVKTYTDINCQLRTITRVESFLWSVHCLTLQEVQCFGSR